jgi:hypothetical protein
MTFDPGTPPAGVIGQPWSWQLPSPSGGNPPYVFDVQPGESLPDSFTITSDGILSGIPSATSHIFPLRVSDTSH